MQGEKQTTEQRLERIERRQSALYEAIKTFLWVWAGIDPERRGNLRNSIMKELDKGYGYAKT